MKVKINDIINTCNNASSCRSCPYDDYDCRKVFNGKVPYEYAILHDNDKLNHKMLRNSIVDIRRY